MPTQPPTIYDVARIAGLSIASVSRVLNGQGNPRADTRQRVLEAVEDLGFVPDGAARALSARLKEVIGVVVRRPQGRDANMFADEDEHLQFPDMINRGMEIVAQRHGFDLLIRSVDLDEPDAGRRIFALARKSDGLILHDRVLSPEQLDLLSRQVPVVTLAGQPTETTANVHGDNEGGMRDLARHLIFDHGYRTIAYLAGHEGSPDSLSRGEALAQEVAVTGFDDIPVARHLLPQLTSVRQSIQDLGATAFETVYAMIGRGPDSADSPHGQDIALPTRLIRRQSCGCNQESLAQINTEGTE